MDKIDRLYNKFVEIFSDVPKGKICIPITGGLDSRVLAHFMPHIDLSYYFYTHRTYRNLDVVKQLWDHFDIKETYPIYVSDFVSGANDALTLTGSTRRALMTAGLNILDVYCDLQNYTVCIAEHVDFYTGLHTARLNLKKYEKTYINETIPKHNETMFNLMTHFFGGYWAPTIESDFFNWCRLNLTFKDRFMQRTYIKMIKKYMPELYNIPRCFESSPPARMGNGYCKQRAKTYFKKQWNI